MRERSDGRRHRLSQAGAAPVRTAWARASIVRARARLAGTRARLAGTAPMRGTRALVLRARRWLGGPGGRRLATAAAVTAVALAGVLVGLAVGGHTNQDVGPFEARFSVAPAFSGGTRIELPPLGSVALRSHQGPARLTIDLASLDTARTQQLFTRPGGVERASATAVDDIGHGVVRLAMQSTAAILLVTMALAAVIFRSVRRVALCGGLALAVIAGTLAVGAGTFRQESIAEPTYEGLLINADDVVGRARQIADHYEAYRDQLQLMVTNVSRLYATVTTLPVFQPDDGTVRVLHISDLHLNPAAWSVIQTVVEQFDIDVIIDSGDITDWGSEPETSYVEPIRRLGVRYIYVRGNHDSPRTEGALADQGATVLDNAVTEAAGLRIAGIGDPRFTPDKSTQEPDERIQAGLRLVGAELARTISAGAPVDIAVVHDPHSAVPLAGVVPVVLAGHRHERELRELVALGPARVPRTTLLIEGSTGGAGLRGLESGQALPLQLSVLYFGRDRALAAYDQISVGGTGQTEVTLERHVVRPEDRSQPQGARTR